MPDDPMPPVGPARDRLVAENKFHAGNRTDGKHYWLTPPDVYAALDAEFGFTFDPCPHPLPDGFDGLTVEWGASNYVNPPFGSIMHDGRKKGPTAWARKALAEHAKGKSVVLVYPLPKWVLMLMAAGAQVRNLGDVRWRATEDGSIGPGVGQHVACFVLRPVPTGKLVPTFCEACAGTGVVHVPISATGASLSLSDTLPSAATAALLQTKEES